MGKPKKGRVRVLNMNDQMLKDELKRPVHNIDSRHVSKTNSCKMLKVRFRRMIKC